MQYWNGNSWDVVAATPNEGATLQMIAGVPTWVGGTPPVIGDTYAGGIIFRIYQPGEAGYVPGEFHGLVCSTANLGGTLKHSILASPGPDVALSTTDGSANTDAIIAQTLAPAANTYAAGICRLYSAPGDGGLNDWYLPAQDELNDMWENLHRFGCSADTFVPACPTAIGNFQYAYWSSTEITGGVYARAHSFASGAQFGRGRNLSERVRVVRAF
jgi:hypothetical protein